ncbi:hypothetical protein [Limnohabitans sp. TS-CS-82]|uniref:hypothetical protein n=1 Tax=Limnohabitans sp. TS-CS-82 TaxID=2094193 RepID=UPI0011AFD8CC|nr:hypothetical protein [Limnohabitans sp. TS-CS-82]
MKKKLSTLEMKALVFIVLESQAFAKNQRTHFVTTDEVTKHIKLEHSEGMKVIDSLRAETYVWLRKRLSSGLTGNGYDGSLFAEINPTEVGTSRAMKYLRVDK